MYHHNVSPSRHYDATPFGYNRENESLQIVDYSRSPNAVTASPSPTSQRIKIASTERHLFDNPHELDAKEFEAEADYREYVMYNRIMQHRSSHTNSFSSALSPLPPSLPLSAESTFGSIPALLNPCAIQRLRDISSDRQISFSGIDVFDQEDTTSTDIVDTEEMLESEVGIFELDM